MEKTMCVRSGDRSAEVECRFKRIKNVHLRVYPDGRVVLSAPVRTEGEWLRRYLDSKAEWIFRAVERYGSADRPARGELCVLGRPRRLTVSEGRSRVELTEDELRVFLPRPDREAAERRAERYLRELALSYFSERVKLFYPAVQSRGAPYPAVSVRRMRSMWGSCSAARAAIRFNTVLLCADAACIDYVVLHELTHLLIAGHQSDFYAFLGSVMPDWRERKRRLNRSFAKYL